MATKQQVSKLMHGASTRLVHSILDDEVEAKAYAEECKKKAEHKLLERFANALEALQRKEAAEAQQIEAVAKALEAQTKREAGLLETVASMEQQMVKMKKALWPQ